MGPMGGESRTMSPIRPEASASCDAMLDYIADMLAELADLAATKRDPALEAVIRIAAIHAERSRRRRG